MKLVDSFGRIHTSLRISVTDRCNIRCFYCMPEHAQFLPRKEILSYEEIVRLTSISAKLGINKIRITGGEPLVRKDLDELIRQLVNLNGIEEVALTTNGVLLADAASKLKSAGLHRLNVSLDCVTEEAYQKMTRRNGIDKVFAGIKAAQENGFSNIRLNAVAIKDLSEDSIVPLAEYASQNQLHLRFIEFMPLDADENWHEHSVLSGSRIRAILEEHFGESKELVRPDPAQPATDFRFPNGASIGFINSVTEPFCSACDRLRLTAEGKFRNCLFSNTDFDVRDLLRGDSSDAEIESRLVECVAAKKAGHGIHSDKFIRPQRSMYQIGG